MKYLINTTDTQLHNHKLLSKKDEQALLKIMSDYLATAKEIASWSPNLISSLMLRWHDKPKRFNALTHNKSDDGIVDTCFSLAEHYHSCSKKNDITKKHSAEELLTKNFLLVNLSYDGLQELIALSKAFMVSNNSKLQENILIELKYWESLWRNQANRLVSHNYRLVWSIVRKYKSVPIEQDDLFQEGVTGLIRAAEKFSMQQGCSFSTYATQWIRQSINRAIEDKSRLIRLPSNIHLKAQQYFGLVAEYDGSANASQKKYAAGKSGLSDHELSLIEKASYVNSLNHTDDDGNEIIDAIGNEDLSPQKYSNQSDTSEFIDSLLSKVTAEEASVIRARFQDNRIFKDIAHELGKSIETIRNIERSALKKLKLSAGNLNHGYP